MIGQEGIAALVMQSIAARVETRLAILNTEQGALTIPDGLGGTVLCSAPVVPVFISDSQLPFDGVQVDQWPFILVIPQGDPTQTRTGIGEDGANHYDVTYEVRAFVWVRGDDYTSTSRVQRRLTQAVKEALLSKQALSANVRIDETSMTVRYSDLVASEAIEATIGGSLINFRLVANERLTPTNAAFGLTQTTVSTAGPLTP